MAHNHNCVVLNDIHIDIMDYILPADCTDTEFRQMWADFEWENKISVSTNISNLNEYLQHILNTTNMKCLTPEKVPVCKTAVDCLLILVVLKQIFIHFKQDILSLTVGIHKSVYKQNVIKNYLT